MEIGEHPIKIGRIRNNVYWRKYSNGTININGEKFLFYTIKEAVRIWRKTNPIKR